MSDDKSENKKRDIKEIYTMVTCPRCGRKYIASDGHNCPKEE
jgi:rRNA maturation protein Nop10